MTQKLKSAISQSAFGDGPRPSIISKDGSISLKSYLKNRSRIKMINKKLRESRLHLNDTYQAYMERIQPITAPLALISQIQRSGGSMLSQLFDGHPQVHAHPHELRLDIPKNNWPPIDLGDRPDRWFEILFEDNCRAITCGTVIKRWKNTRKRFFLFFCLLCRKNFFKIFKLN
jgi:hypothetical protein